MIEVRWYCPTCGPVLAVTLDIETACDPVRFYNEVQRAVTEHRRSHDNGHQP